MKIAIVDDMPDEADRLREDIDRWCRNNAVSYECDTYPDGSILICNSLSGEYDLVFLDIYMKELDGIETARVIRRNNAHCCIVFLTSSSEHMQEAFSVHAFDYINKPADYQKIARVLNDLNSTRTQDDHFLNLYVDKHNYRIAFGDLISIEADSNYCLITADARYRSRVSFGEIKKELAPDRRFLAINRGLIVNMDYVRSMDNGICTFKNGCFFPINSRKCHELKQAFIDYNFMKRHERNDRGGLL